LSAAHHVSEVPIAVNQIEFHPWLQRPEWVDYCRDTDTVVEAAAPLARTEIFAEGTVRDLAEAYGRSPAQVVLKWAVERGVVVLPKSTSTAHIEANLDLFDWEMDEADLRRLDDVDRGEPVYDVRGRSWTDDTYGISE
jgi:diketogulonate reductase-like aldo/keto reductase